MVAISELISKHKASIISSHENDDKFVAVVTNNETREALLEGIPPKIKAHITVRDSEFPEQITPNSADEISIIYRGALPISSMKLTGFGKKDNPQFFPAFVRVFEENEVFEPVILGSDMSVIDGEQRILSVIELNNMKHRKHMPIDQLPAIVLNTTELQTKFLRLVLNKSNEFQRWHWDEVDAFLEEHLELLPQLEPLAIFGERVLPESYFGNTVVGYEIHAEEGVKSQQSYYKQEHGLARWAKDKRARLEEEAKKSRTAIKAASREKTLDLFEALKEDS